MGFTGLNSSDQFQAKKLPNEVDFYVHLNGHSLCVFVQFENLLVITI